MLDNPKRNNVLIGLIVFVFALAVYFVNPLQQIINNKIIAWDGAGYYLYLPSAFIYHDFLQLNYIPKLFHQYEFSSSFYQAFKVDNGNYVMNYPMGVAILQLPFFLIAHAIAHLTNYPADGFSTPYQLMVVVAGLFYTIVGLLLLYKLLVRYFSKEASLIACAAIMLGTNLYNYGFTEPDMSHAYIFFLFSVILLLTDNWYKQAALKTTLLLALVTGLIVICRPTLLVVFIVILLWKADSMQGLKQNLLYISRQFKYLAISVFACIIPVGLQMLYWKYSTGHWVFNTYGSQGLGFDFLHPSLRLGLVHIRKGWLFYTPIVIAMLYGFRILRKQKTIAALPFIIYLVVDIWIVFSWTIWYYGGGFSARAMVESYAVLAFPFTALIEYSWQQKKTRLVLFSFIAFCCLLNLFQTWQYTTGIIGTTGLCSRYEYRKKFFSTTRDLVPASYMDKNELMLPTHIISTTKVFDTIYPSGGVACNQNNQYIDPRDFTGKELKSLKANRIRFTVKAGYENNDALLYNPSASLYITFEKDNNYRFLKMGSIPSQYKTGNPVTQTMELQIPPDMKDDDESKLFVTNDTPLSLYVYELKIELLQTK